MFGIGLPELAVIAFVAVLVFGPDKLPELARQAGGFLRKAKSFANNARDELRDQLGPDYADLELTDLDPRNFVKKQLADVMAEEDDQPPARRSRSVSKLGPGERPPFDLDAT